MEKCNQCSLHDCKPCYECSACAGGDDHFRPACKTNKVEKLQHIEFEKPWCDSNLENMTFSITKNIITQIVDMEEKAVVDAVIKAAEQEGVTDLYLLDKKFVLDALREKAEREKGCEYCRERKPILNSIGLLQIDDSDNTIWFTMRAAADDIYEDHTDIRFCPMCGRRLDKEDI